jgi:hypothetical protein
MDGIESAPKELFEKISSLAGADPFLDLFEKGPDFLYSRNAEQGNQIHEDFHLFITYNSSEIESHRCLSPSILNKFVTFVLQPIDSSILMIAIVLNGLLQSQKVQRDLLVIVSAWLAQVHCEAKQYAKDHSPEFAPGLAFTGRNLVFGSRIVGSQDIHYDAGLGSAFSCVISFIYCRPSKCSAECYGKLLTSFTQSPALDILQCVERSVAHVNEDYRQVLQPLRKLQLFWDKSGSESLPLLTTSKSFV